MGSVSFFFKSLAVVSSLLLAGGYVWFRGGGAIPYIAPGKKSAPAPSTPTPPEHERSANDIEVPPELLAKADDRTLLGGSKSDRVNFYAPSEEDHLMFHDSKPKANAPPASLPNPYYEHIDLDKPEPNERTILGGSKSSALDFKRVEEHDAAKDAKSTGAVAAPKQPDVIGIKPRTLMYSSKVGKIQLERVIPQPTVPLESRAPVEREIVRILEERKKKDVPQQRAVKQEPTPQVPTPRTFLLGPKAAFPGFDPPPRGERPATGLVQPRIPQGDDEVKQPEIPEQQRQRKPSVPQKQLPQDVPVFQPNF